MSPHEFESTLKPVVDRGLSLGAICTEPATTGEAWKAIVDAGAAAPLIALFDADPYYRRFSAIGVFRTPTGASPPGPHTLAYWATQRGLCVGTEQTLAELEQYRQQSAYPATITLTLAYLTVKERYELAGGIRIVPFTMEDFCGPRPRKVNGLRRPVDPMDEITAALQMDIDYPFIDLDHDTTGLPSPIEAEALDQLREARLCLGLMRPSFVAEVGNTVTPALSTPGAFPGSHGTRSKGFIDDATTVALSDTELMEVRALHEQYRALPPEQKEELRTSVQRLETAIVERDGRKPNSAVDSAIDLGIALEALLMSGSKGELSYRFSLRGAHLLGGAVAADRRTYFAKLHGLYQIRSSAVHEGQIKKGHLDKPARQYVPEELLLEGYAIAARAIREVIRRGGIPADWESIVLG